MRRLSARYYVVTQELLDGFRHNLILGLQWVVGELNFASRQQIRTTIYVKCNVKPWVLILGLTNPVDIFLLYEYLFHGHHLPTFTLVSLLLFLLKFGMHFPSVCMLHDTC
jgi:hypothetical protein